MKKILLAAIIFIGCTKETATKPAPTKTGVRIKIENIDGTIQYSPVKF